MILEAIQKEIPQLVEEKEVDTATSKGSTLYVIHSAVLTI